MPDLFKNWDLLLRPLYDRYGSLKHPLDFKSRFQLLVMVLLSAQDSDVHINTIAHKFFSNYPSMKELASSSETLIASCIRSVSHGARKAAWLEALAKKICVDENIPRHLSGLCALPGIGRKSANVIIRESGDEAEGIIVDLHVVRVAPRLGLSHAKTPEKIESDLMEMIPQKEWNRAGMALSFLGREICRPSNPHCSSCLVKDACEWEGKRL
jgi:endonuclease-3